MKTIMLLNILLSVLLAQFEPTHGQYLESSSRIETRAGFKFDNCGPSSDAKISDVSISPLPMEVPTVLRISGKAKNPFNVTGPVTVRYFNF